MPSMKGSVRLTYPDHVIFSKSKGLHPDDDCENDDDVSDLDDDFVDEDENFIYVYYSLKNERKSHMLGPTINKVSRKALALWLTPQTTHENTSPTNPSCERSNTLY